jgi:hypothetical protein
MINVMVLRQFYERREITEMIWIHGINNSVDSMIKIKSFTVLKTVIDINHINLDTIEWIERATTRDTVNQLIEIIKRDVQAKRNVQIDE